MDIKTFKKIDIVVTDSMKVGVWIFLSAGITALVSYLLQKPELAAYYGLLNIALYAINKLDEQFRRKK